MNKYLRFFIDPVFRFSVLSSYGFYDGMDDRLFLKKKFKLSMGRELRLDKPETYNEKLQWLKLYNRRPEQSIMVDKHAVKEYITKIIGPGYVIPTLGVYDRFDDIDFKILPDKFVLKCTHDSGGIVVCRDKETFNIESARKKINNSLNRNYYRIGREWPYKNVSPRIIIEEFIISSNNFNDDPTEGVVSTQFLQKKYGLLDYKFMCFDGKVKAVFLDIGVIGNCSGHSEEYYRNIYDRNWVEMPVKETREHYPMAIMKPKFYDRMVQLAEIISSGHPHLRVDMYNIDGKILIGELTFYHGSGLTNKFVPEKWDFIFGSWIKLPND